MGEKWRVGCGMMGEQGAESLHAQFNTTERAYNNMRDRVQRLKVVLEAHHLRLMPANIAMEPPPIKKENPRMNLNSRVLTCAHTYFASYISLRHV